MDRVCFRLQVDPTRLEEYRQRHADVWPDMLSRTAARPAGTTTHSSWLMTVSSSAISSVDDFTAAQAAMAASRVNARWQAEMADFFVDLGDSRPDEGMRPLTEVFHLD